MENIKEEFMKYLLQEEKSRLAKLSKTIYVYKSSQFYIGQSDIWVDVSDWLDKKNNPNNAAQDIYEEKFLKVFYSLLESADLDIFLDNFIKSNGYDKRDKSSIKLWLPLKLLNQPLAMMLNNHLSTSIDLRSVENNKVFLSREVPQYLKGGENKKGWEDKDKELFFNNLWEILKGINFTDEEIGTFWRENFT